jgi:hypothetical protein
MRDRLDRLEPSRPKILTATGMCRSNHPLPEQVAADPAVLGAEGVVLSRDLRGLEDSCYNLTMERNRGQYFGQVEVFFGTLGASVQPTLLQQLRTKPVVFPAAERSVDAIMKHLA